jgi:hypothetical protein
MLKQEYSIFSQLKEMLKTDTKTYYILWKYAPEFLPCDKQVVTFEDLVSTYKCFKKQNTEESCYKWLIESATQTAIKWLLNKTHGIKMTELYHQYYEKSKTDVQCFKAFCDFSEDFFATEKDSELLAILAGISDEDLSDAEE